MTVPYAFSAATSAIPLSQLDANFNTTITLGNTAIQLGNTVTTLNNMTLANVTISSGNVTLTNVTVTTANATTVNTTTLIATTANVTTVNATNINVATTSILNYGTANGVAYLNASKALTTGSALWFDGTNFGVGTGGNTLNHQSVLYKGGANSVYFQVGNGSTGLGATQGLRLGVTSAGLGELYSVTSMTSYIDGTGAMFLNSTGLVVGNTSVSAKLEGWYTSTAPSLSSSTGAGLSLRGTSTLRVNIGSDPSSPFGGWIQASDGGGTAFPLSINPLGGNLGIGTSSPGSKLHIDGNFIRIEQTGANTAYFGNAADLITGAPVGLGIRFNNTALRIAYSGTQIAMFDSSGNLGLGVTPSAWVTGVKAFQVGGIGALFSDGTTYAYTTGVASNAIQTGASTWTYRIAATGAARYEQLGTAHSWYQSSGAPSAGGTITFTQAMTLDASGRLVVGTTSPISTYDKTITVVGSGSAGLTMGDGTRQYAFGVNGGALQFYDNTASVERARINSSGSFVAGGSVALATTATDGFLYVPTCAGTPTGTPTAITGMAPIVVNTTNNKLYFYSGGAWRDAGP